MHIPPPTGGMWWVDEINITSPTSAVGLGLGAPTFPDPIPLSDHPLCPAGIYPCHMIPAFDDRLLHTWIDDLDRVVGEHGFCFRVGADDERSLGFDPPRFQLPQDCAPRL